MNESDDDDEDGDGGGDDGKSEKSGGTRSGNASEDDWTDESNSVIRFVTFSMFTILHPPPPIYN